jgi:tetratricopeptide (TPR) repeat protein
LTSMCNLSVQYFHLGKFENSRDLDEQTVALSRKILGLEHPHTLIFMNNLAQGYYSLEDYDTARKLHEQTLALRKRLLGVDAPDTLISMIALAEAYEKLGLEKKLRR